MPSPYHESDLHSIHTLKYITRSIFILSLISLLNDIASEMLIPIMPLYLKSIGFSMLIIGILEGLAEATAGLSKGYFGKLSDISGKRVPFVQIGYALSAIAKPMIGTFAYPLWVLLARTMDKIGKGIRTGARDAILSDESTPETKAKVFGFHRAMDTLGAVIGPVLALIYLHYYPENYKTLFLIAFLPGVLTVLTSTFLKEKRTNIERKDAPKPHIFSFLHYWKDSPPLYRKVVIGLLIFTLFNSSDVFLLLRIQQVGLTDPQIIEVYIFYNLIFALSSLPMGIWADKLGLKKIFLLGLALFALVYIGMAFKGNIYFYLSLFFLYGLYAAANDGISKAWISNISDKKDTATAIGTYSGLQSICAMLASSLAGFIWFQFGAVPTFLMSGIAAIGVIIYFLFFISVKKE